MKNPEGINMKTEYITSDTHTQKKKNWRGNKKSRPFKMCLNLNI